MRVGDFATIDGLVRSNQLNGTACTILSSEGERFKCVLSTGKKILVKPTNIIVGCRTKAINQLRLSMEERYPSVGFTCNAKLSFCESKSGQICIKANAKIGEGEILLVVPESARVTAKKNAPKDKTCIDVITNIRQARTEKYPYSIGVNNVMTKTSQLVTPEELDLIVICMHGLSAAARNTEHCTNSPHYNNANHALVAATWPQDLRENPLFWTEEEVELFRGLPAYQQVCVQRKGMKEIFSLVVEPVMRQKGVFALFTEDVNAEDGLFTTFLRASAVVSSRSHQGKSGPEIVPLVEMFNGVPTGHPKCNVEIHSGKWPFLHGSVYRNDCDLAVSGVSALRTIQAGEELYISYGELTTVDFVAKYGAVPSMPNGWNNPRDVVVLAMLPSILPPITDELRWRAFSAFGYNGCRPDEGGTNICYTDADKDEPDLEKATAKCKAYNKEYNREGIHAHDLYHWEFGQYSNNGVESENLKSFRQFHMLLVGNDELLENVSSFGRFRTSYFNPRTLGEAFIKTVDANMNRLFIEEGRKVSMTSNSPAMKMHLLYKSWLSHWRSAFKARYNL